MTQLNNLAPEQFLVEMHKLITMPSLIILFVFAILTFFIVGMLILKTPKGRKNFMKIFIISLFLIATIFIFLIISPMLTQNIISFFGG